jgi:hypothetical protein
MSTWPQMFAASQALVTAIQFSNPVKEKPGQSVWLLMEGLARSAQILAWVAGEFGRRSSNSDSHNRLVTWSVFVCFAVWGIGQVTGYNSVGYKLHEFGGIATLLIVLNWLRTDIASRRSSWTSSSSDVSRAANDAQDRVRAGADRAQGTMSSNAQDFPEKLRASADRVQETTSRTVKDLSDKASDALHKVADTAQQAYDKVVHAGIANSAATNTTGTSGSLGTTTQGSALGSAGTTTTTTTHGVSGSAGVGGGQGASFQASVR